MKKILLAFLVLLLFSVSANAETTDGKEQAQTDTITGEMRPPVPPMPMCMPIMKQQMMGHGMMMQNMMFMMKDIIKLQKRMLKDMNPAEKKEMLMESGGMMDKLDKMMSDMQGMMMKEMLNTPPPPETPKTETKKDEHGH